LSGHPTLPCAPAVASISQPMCVGHHSKSGQPPWFRHTSMRLILSNPMYFPRGIFLAHGGSLCIILVLHIIGFKRQTARWYLALSDLGVGNPDSL
jgi:hypothetical protein